MSGEQCCSSPYKDAAIHSGDCALRFSRALPLYCAMGTCPKCGGEQIGDTWCHENAWTQYRFDGRLMHEGHADERIHRTCQRCGFVWSERPLDTASA